MTKRTNAELWNALDEATLDAELEAVLAMTPEERREELVKAGYDLDKVHADADAFFASLPPATGPAPVATAVAVAAPVPTAAPAQRPKRTRMVVTVFGALALAAVLALVIKAAQPPPPVGASPGAHAAALRREARAACEAHVWKTCLDKLDEARGLDPDGDQDPDVQRLRQSAAEAPDRH